MHPLLKQLRGLAVYLLVWMLAACALAVAWVRLSPSDWIGVLGFLLPLALLTGMAALSMYAVCRSFPLRPARWMSTLIRRAAAAGVLALLVTGVATLWNATGSLWGRDGLVTLTPTAWLAFIGVQAVLYGLAALMHDALLAQQTLQAARATEASARLLAREMEIKALRAQLDPHFLFNSLNSISSLIHLDPAAARAMTIDLAGFFRQTLRLGECERIRLEEELALVQHYLAVEQRRLGDRLSLCIDVDAACRVACLPPLVLQPLVENAIKHGIRQLDLGGRIELGASHVGSHLVLRVSNPVDAHASRDASGLGQGLRHLRSRLLTQYGGSAFVELERTASLFTVQITLPWQA